MAGPNIEPPPVQPAGGAGKITVHNAPAMPEYAAQEHNAAPKPRNHHQRNLGRRAARTHTMQTAPAIAAAAAPSTAPQHMPQGYASFQKADGTFREMTVQHDTPNPDGRGNMVSAATVEPHMQNHGPGMNTIAMEGVGSRAYDPNKPVTMANTSNDHSMRGGPGPNTATIGNRTTMYQAGTVTENQVAGRKPQIAAQDTNCATGGGRRSCYSDLKTASATANHAPPPPSPNVGHTAGIDLTTTRIAPASPGFNG
ncbi:MAG: hypothetical protein ABTQ34_07530 [Bdellovibrionales bacterium]